MKDYNFESLDNEETEARLYELEMLIEARQESLDGLLSEFSFRKESLYK